MAPSADAGADPFTSFTTAFRLEQQPAYDVPEEAATLARWRAGQPEPCDEVPGLIDWYRQVSAWTAAGRTVSRVRVQDTPPTNYQQWERWGGRWSVAAGEHIRYMTRADARAAGLPDRTTDDWWLFDDSIVLTMHYDATGRFVGRSIDTDPERVRQYRAWRDLAMRHSSPDEGALDGRA